MSRDVDMTDPGENHPVTVRVAIPPSFMYVEELQQISQLVISLLESGMPKREIAKRLMRYHPAQEG